MARLHEYQGKGVLAAGGIAVPEGELAHSPEQCGRIAEKLACAVVVKAQVWGTGRAAAGGVRFAKTPAETVEVAREILGAPLGGVTVESVLVEERLNIKREFYLGCIIDDRERRPVLLLSAAGGSGIEERTRLMQRLTVSVRREPRLAEVQEMTESAGVAPDARASIAKTLLRLYRIAKNCEARVLEINPLAQTMDGRFVALDCRISVDDYAVFRHPALGIEIARELGHPPTRLDRIAWAIEENDYRGTFYFVELPHTENAEGLLIGFHGAGGGGSMASLDAALRAGLQPVNYTDTSGNPAASKVYRAARIILRQPGIRGYFLSGSGVASQEQFHLARALVKAFREERLQIPAVLRLGGNGEELAARIVHDYLADLPAPIEAYGKKDTADFCASRLRKLIEEPRETVTTTEQAHPVAQTTTPAAQPLARDTLAPAPYTFATRTGEITYDHAICVQCPTKACVKECVPQILSVADQVPILNITREEAARGKCIECLACEVECWFQGAGGATIKLPIEEP